MRKKAPTTRTINPLPFQDLDPRRFEDLIRNLIYDFKIWSSIEATGRAGSDDGFDVRAWEETNEVSNADDDEVGVHPMDGNLWKIQCKRERQLGPTRIKAIVDEGVKEDQPPYGYILAASTTFSKKSYDVFREALRSKGVMEFHLWGKSELEDMLLLPKNDSILFAFFGISLITRKRSRASEIRFSIINKNKLLRILSDGDPQRAIHKSVLARDLKDTKYPYKREYEDFDRVPRWKQYTAVGFHPLGLVFDVAEHFAYVDKKTKQWDFCQAVNLLSQQYDDPDQSERISELRESARNRWRSVPRMNRGYLFITGVIPFEEMMAIDDKGDSLYDSPHIFVDFSVQSGPFRWSHHKLRVNGREIELDDDFKRIDFFSEISPPPKQGKIHRDRKVQLEEQSARQFWEENFLRSLFCIGNKYDFLKQGDVIQVEGVKSMTSAKETFVEITSRYRISGKDYIDEYPDLRYRAQIERQIGRELKDSDELTVLEFESAYGVGQSES